MPQHTPKYGGYLIRFWQFWIWQPESSFLIYSHPGLSKNIPHLWCFVNFWKTQPTPKYGGYPLIRCDLWVMGEWSVGQWIVGVISFQKMYGLYGLKSIYIGINAHVTDAGRTNKQTTSEDRATQLLICEPLSLANIITNFKYFQNLVRPCFLITLIKWVKDHRSLGSLFNVKQDHQTWRYITVKRNIISHKWPHGMMWAVLDS